MQQVNGHRKVKNKFGITRRNEKRLPRVLVRMLKRILVGFVVLLQLLLIVFPGAYSEETDILDKDNWPMYGHDPMHTGYSLSTAPETDHMFLSTRLKPPLSPVSVFDSPAFVNGILYIGFSDGVFSCMNAYTGSIYWEKQLGDLGSISGTPAVIDGRIYIGAGNSLVCLNAENGQLLWTFPTGDLVKGSPTVTEDKVYFGSYDHKIYCLNTNGGEIWNVTTEKQVFTAPAVVGGNVYCAASTPTVGGESYIYCFSADSGTMLWSFGVGTSPATPCTVMAGKVYVGVMSTMYCLDAQGDRDNCITTQVWKMFVYHSYFAAPAVTDGRVYFGDKSDPNPKIYCCNAITGTVIWNCSLGTVVTCPPVVADGKLYIGGWDKRLYCIDAAGTSEGTTNVLWSAGVGTSVIRGQPVIAGGNVWVVTQNTYLYGFGMNNPLLTPEKPTGPAIGEANTEYTFTTRASNPKGEQMWYQWKFGAYTTEWFGPYNSGAEVHAQYLWTVSGTHEVKVKAKDKDGMISRWSPIFYILITSNSQKQIDIYAPASVPEGNDFTVTVTLDNTPIIGATVTFTNQSRTTDLMGEVTFTAPQISHDTPYTISTTAPYDIVAMTTIIVIDTPTPIYGYIYGIITDQSSTSLEDVQINVLSDVEKKQTSSDAKGRYNLPVSAGMYTVVASKSGYKTSTTTNVVVEEKKATELNVILELQELPQSPSGTTGVVEYMIQEKVTQGLIGARMDISADYTPTITSYVTDLTIQINYLTEKISFTVNAPNSTGPTILVVRITDKNILPDPTSIEVTIDDQKIAKESNVEAFFNQEIVSEPRWLYISTEENEKYALIKITHFSTHTITISSIVGFLSSFIVAILFITLIILAITIFIVPVYLLYFRKSKG